jgi:hypothetical protein
MFGYGFLKIIFSGEMGWIAGGYVGFYVIGWTFCRREITNVHGEFRAASIISWELYLEVVNGYKENNKNDLRTNDRQPIHCL